MGDGGRTDDNEAAADRDERAEDRKKTSDERTALARVRTDASANRTVLANERTFTAWLRTGMSAIALGLAVPRLLTTSESAYVGTWLALILIVLGVAMTMLAGGRYYRVAKDLRQAGLELTPAWLTMMIVAGLALVGVLAVVLVLIG